MDADTYAFIDANSLKQDMRHCMDAIYDAIPEVMDFGHISALLENPHHHPDMPQLRSPVGKVFWYDVQPDPLLPNDKGQQNDPRFQERMNENCAQIAARESEFAAVQQRPGWHVRSGTYRRKGNTTKANSQKEVDVLLACDALAHVLRGNTKRVLLWTGDLDFRPLVEQLVQFGAFVTVIGGRHSLSRGLVDAADDAVTLRARQYWVLCSPEYRGANPQPQPMTRSPAPSMSISASDPPILLEDRRAQCQYLSIPRKGWHTCPPNFNAHEYCRYELGNVPRVVVIGEEEVESS